MVDYGAVTKSLLSWWVIHGRKLPWRCTNDPYKVLIAAVLLRKTNAAKVVKVYEEFLRKYPSIEALATAREDDLVELLRPLGLHRQRARDLRRMAAQILEKYGGEIPADPPELVRIKGVGEYAANAVACFAYGKEVLVIDSMTTRVLRRLLGQEVLENLREVEERILRYAPAREVNFALIDLAALVCRPKKPKCSECPLKQYCAYCRSLKSPSSVST